MHARLRMHAYSKRWSDACRAGLDKRLGDNRRRGSLWRTAGSLCDGERWNVGTVLACVRGWHRMFGDPHISELVQCRLHGDRAAAVLQYARGAVAISMAVSTPACEGHAIRRARGNDRMWRRRGAGMAERGLDAGERTRKGQEDGERSVVHEQGRRDDTARDKYASRHMAGQCMARRLHIIP